MIIKGQDVDEILYKCSVELNSKEVFTSPRGLKTRELIAPKIILENPTKCIITNSGRKFSVDYLKHELEWYLSCKKSISKIKKFAKMWGRIKNKNGNANSNYGEIIFKQKLRNYKGFQYDWVIDSLLSDKDSRQAIINFNQPKHKSKGNLDFVCTISMQFLIRDDKLIAITTMRSNDLIYGFCYDIPFFSYIQQRVLKDLQKKYTNLKLGEYIHIPISLHVYEKHFNMLKDIIHDWEFNQPISLTLDNVC